VYSEYSLYTGAARAQNYLRGVQVADADGLLEFTSVFPGCYDGRWPHAHVEVYPTLQAATGGSRPLRTTQLALPQQACEQAYATTGYAQSARNLSRVSLDTDLAFRDGYALQLARTTRSAGGGWTAELAVPV